MRPFQRPLSLFFLIGLALGGLACSYGEYRPDDPMNMGNSLDASHRAYTNYVRWSKFDEAASYVAVADRPAFLAEMPDFDLARFTDWKANAWEFQELENPTNAVIEVTYRAYSMSNPVEIKIKEKQQWSRKDSDEPWRVKSEFTGLGQFGTP
jgi:hypothetical protein